jgi:hypothetical protein
MIQIVGRCIAAKVKSEKWRVTSGKILGWDRRSIFFLFRYLFLCFCFSGSSKRKR